ncbi:hypothetical protein H0H93_004991 [Arthromyces matolae]|nr:hypothetical protein H0H93_004991 [Arthromyces matolae]
MPVENALNSPGGWSDLPSDNEDVFFLDPEEVDDFRRDKKRRHLEELREERLKGRLAEEGEPIDAAEEIWGGSDEEPDDTQRELMHRTANHILSSPNATQLEARILANHGTDPRFSFLRGRWSNAWKIIKGKSRLAKQNEDQERKQQSTNILGGLTGYGSGSDEDDDSDKDEDNEERGVQKEIETDDLKVPQPSQPPQMTEEEIKETRRARAKEWTQKYRLQKNDLYEASVEELQSGLNAGHFSSVDLVKAYLARIDEVNLKGPCLRAVFETNANALATAAELDAERKEKG